MHICMHIHVIQCHIHAYVQERLLSLCVTTCHVHVHIMYTLLCMLDMHEERDQEHIAYIYVLLHMYAYVLGVFPQVKLQSYCMHVCIYAYGTEICTSNNA
jgi:hypothetical protein